MITAASSAIVTVVAGEWWSGLEAVSAELTCGGAVHSIEWRDGSLVLTDHDEEAEWALLALGSRAVPECLQAAQAWKACCETQDAQLLLGWFAFLAPNADATKISMSLREGISNALNATARYPAHPRAPLALQNQHPEWFRRWVQACHDALRLLDLPARLLERLGITVAFAGRPDPLPASPVQLQRQIAWVLSTSVMAMTTAATVGLAWPGMSYDSFGPGRTTGPGSGSRLVCRLAAEGTPPAVNVRTRKGAMRGEVALRSDWPAKVYARGLCTQTLVLDVVEENNAHDRMRVWAARWERRKLVTRQAELSRLGPGVWTPSW